MEISPRTSSALPCASNHACTTACHYLQIDHDDDGADGADGADHGDDDTGDGGGMIMVVRSS